MRIVFMGAPDFSVPILEQLVHSQHKVVAVYTQPDRPAGRGRGLSYPPLKEAATALGLEVYQPPSIKSTSAVDSLLELHPDVIVVASFGQILPSQILNAPQFGCINIHPSLLPKYRGPTPIATAILSGEEVTGVSIMLMDEGIDSGPILAQRSVEIMPQDTTASLTAKLARIGADLLTQTLPRWFSNSIKPQPQPEGEATHTKLISKDDGDIDWQLPAYRIWRQVRAYHPWPGCYTTWCGKRLKVIDAIPMPGDRGEPGTAFPLEKGEAGVQTGEGILMLLVVQLEGKKQMTAEDFLRGQRGFIGTLLPS